MRKENIVIVGDSETCNLFKSDKVLPGNNLTYDIGFSAVVPTKGKVLFDRSYIVSEIFFGEQERMNSAYYANKLPQYYADIASGKRVVKSFFEIMNEINQICKDYNVIAFCAHNARFDIDALNTTARYLTGLDYVHALPDSLEIWDSMKLAKVFTGKKYSKFCADNGFLTKHKPPRNRMTAEVLYRYITNDVDFIESHTALEDVIIEREIVFKAYRMHKKMDKILYTARA